MAKKVGLNTSVEGVVGKFEISEIKGNKKVKTMTSNPGGKTVAVVCLKK